MSYADLILPEYDRETANTRKVLECVPEDKLDWRARPTMNTIGWNANHLVEIANWCEGILKQDSWNVAPVGAPPYASPNLRTRAELLARFDAGVAAGRRAILEVKDEELSAPWSLLMGERVIFTLPRGDCIRKFLLNHTIHHRAILTVYLRLNDIATPAMYDAGG
jgi:uncharacterized damage-inducible protein DinB